MEEKLILTTETIDNIASVTVKNNLVLINCRTLKEYVEPIIESDVNGIILNCTDAKHIDSSGLGLLITCFRKLKEKTASFALCGLSKNLSEILELTQFHKVIPVYKTEKEARANMI